MARSDVGKRAQKQPLHAHLNSGSRSKSFDKKGNIAAGGGHIGGSLTGFSERVVHPHAASPSIPSIVPADEAPCREDPPSKSFPFRLQDSEARGSAR